ncbi:hypothetical protein BCR42DRAFT_423508 [Absidia repens]|uniref:BTB domain-containing protein n=1 Tax=Absidia repens TaxID=90262 RepID=A0A1X2I571_9FUNG|nr:hypothetical protein BCR42DRAFT_423508 [Absidia repens]
MFKSPSHTLSSSLLKVVEHPKEYLADICCHFYDAELWVHRGILLSRCPSAFLQRFIPSVNDKLCYNTDEVCIINISDISSSLFKLLLTYWYTASLPSYPLSERLDAQLDCLEKELDIELIPRPRDKNSVQEVAHLQLLKDLDRMRQDKIGCDVHLSIPAENDTVILIPTHRFILASQSTYFYAMFCTDFCESQNKVVHLTDHFFTPVVIQVILQYLYSETVYTPPPPQLDSVYNSNINTQFSSSSPITLTKIQNLTMKRHTLRVLQLTYAAADYLGQMKTLGYAILHSISRTCDEFKCLCHDCVLLLPSMLSFADKKKDDPLLSPLRAALVILYSDPTHAIEHLWSQKPFAILVHSMVPSAASMMKTLDSSVPLDELHKPSSTLISEISELTYANVTKHNAIHVLHSLHLCFSKLRSADLVPTWSLPTLDLLAPILHSTVTMVSQHFDFYCVEYPILLSCVDGIGCGFSIDFLDFLLKRILDQGIQDANAGIIYQGIVKDLIGRQEIVKNIALDDVLLNARVQCTDYLARRWISVKSMGGFRYLEKATLRQISVDIGIPYRALAKPFDSDLLSLLIFGPITSKRVSNLKPGNDATYPTSSKKNRSTISFSRRRSSGTNRYKTMTQAMMISSSSTTTTSSSSSSSTTASPAALSSRPRSHSSGVTPSSPFRPAFHSTKTDPSAGYVNYNTLNALSSQPLIHLLSMETESRKCTQKKENTPDYSYQTHELTLDEKLLDALLPMEMIVPVTTSTVTNKKQGKTAFRELKHTKSSLDKTSKWGISIGSGNDPSEDDEEIGSLTTSNSVQKNATLMTPMIGARN